MDEHRIAKSTNRWLIFIIIILILVIIGLTRYIIYQNTIFNKKFIYNTDAFYKQTAEDNAISNANEINKTGATEKENSIPKVKTFTIKLISEEGREKEYPLDNDYTIHTKITKVDESMVEYNFTINDSDYTYNDWDWYDSESNSITLKFYKIGNYLSYENTGTTDIRSSHLYIFNKSGDLLKEIYSYDDNDNIEENIEDDIMKEMVIEEISYVENAMLITTTRLNHGPSILYNGKMYEGGLYSQHGGKEAADIPKDTPIKKQYKYTINNEGEIDFDNPEVTILETYQDFIVENPGFITD